MGLREIIWETVPNNENNDFKLMKSLNVDRPTLNSLTDKSALDLINQAHEKAEEVETVCYGLELDDGQIVKVYVNAEEGDAFEKALGDKLGAEDDIEKAIDELADEYDIVKVEWPEQRGQFGQPGEEGQEGEQPDGELDNPGENNEGEEPGEWKEYALDFDLSAKAAKPKKDKKKGEEGSGEDEEEKPAGEEGEEGSGEDEEEKSGEEDEEEPEFDFGDLGGTKKKKKKGKKKEKAKDEDKEVKESFLYANFLNKPALLETKKKEDKVMSEKELKLEDIFKTSFQQKLVKLLCLMDFPVDRMLSRKSLVRKSIRARASELQSDTKAKFLINRLVKDLSTLITHDDLYDKQHKLASHYKEADLTEQKDIEEKMTNKFQKVLIQLYKELGVPEVLLNTKQSQLRAEIKKTARIFATHAKIKSSFIKLAKHLGIHHSDDEEIKEALYEATDEADDQNKPADQAGDFAENFSKDKFTNLIIALVMELGIPQDNLDYKRPAIMTSIRTHKRQLQSGTVRGRLVGLYKALRGEEITEGLTMEEVSSAEFHRAADLGDWSIGQLGENGIILEIEDVSIKLKDKSLDLFKSSIENGLSTFVKDGNDEWQFKSIYHGRKYIAINEDADNYANGIILHEKDVDNIIDALDKI